MPNHHFSIHIGDQIRDYGPVYGFWCFLSERLNKVLKSYNLNNHDGGEMEVTIMRSFNRNQKFLDMVRVAFYPNS